MLDKKVYQQKWYIKNKAKVKEASRIWALKNPDKKDIYNRRSYLKQNRGISLELYNELFSNQKGLCAVCYCPPATPSLYVDHNHSTGNIRGLLCSKCNFAIGLFNDDIERLTSAITYLKENYETSK